MNRTQGRNIAPWFMQTIPCATKDRKEELFSAISNLSGMDLLEMKEDIIKAFQKVVDREENFFLHDYIDKWLYVVSYDDNSTYHYCKGKEAYTEYKTNPHAIAITRKSKDLFPTFQVMMSKVEGYVFIPQKGEKEMSKKDYDIQYQKEHTKRIYFVLNKDLDFDIIKFLATKKNVNGFLKELIREEIKKEGA